MRSCTHASTHLLLQTMDTQPLFCGMQLEGELTTEIEQLGNRVRYTVGRVIAGCGCAGIAPDPRVR